MSNYHKYGNVPIWCNLDTLESNLQKTGLYTEYFASKLEFETYRVLRQYFPKESIKRQYKILIKPQTKKFSEVLWRIDFAIVDNSEKVQFLIESKGFLTDDFKLKLSFLEYREPIFFNKLIIVANVSTQFNKEISAISLVQLSQRLKSYGLVFQQKAK